jgi:hypothetical protein
MPDQERTGRFRPVVSDAKTDPWEAAAQQYKQQNAGAAKPTGTPAANEDWKLWQTLGAQASPQQPGFGQRLYENTIGGPVRIAQRYIQHVQENTPKYGVLSGFPALGQTVLDVGNGISNGVMNAGQKTVEAARKGEYGHAAQQSLGLIPFVGPQLVQASEDGGAGNYRGAAGDVLGFGVSMAAPKVISKGMQLVGRAVKAPAPPIAESALGIRGTQRAYGATPGKAILDDTTGYRPEQIERSAQAKASDLNTDLETRAAQASDPASLVPARSAGTDVIQKAVRANSTKTPKTVQPMVDQLTTPRDGFAGTTEYPAGAHTPISFAQRPTGVLGATGQPISTTQLVRGASPEPVIAAEQSPLDLLRMKRQFGRDFIDDWKPTDSKQGLSTAKEMYHGLDQELDRTVPGASQIDQRIQSLIPVIDRSSQVGLNGTVLEKSLARIAKPTGALAGALTGMFKGGEHFGAPGALVGAVAGLGAPEIISSPVLQMGAARTLHGLGGGLIKVSGPTGNTLGNVLRAGQLLRIPSTEK